VGFGPTCRLSVRVSRRGSAGARAEGFWSLVAPQVWNELRSGRYDVVWLHGHNYAANLIALMAAKAAGLPVLMRGETHLGLPCSGIKSVVRRPVMSVLYGCCDRLLAIGSANAAYYRAMGVPDKKIFVVPYSVDNDRFVQSASLTAEQRAEVRKRYNVPTDRPCVPYAAKFTLRKRPPRGRPPREGWRHIASFTASPQGSCSDGSTNTSEAA
jgi:glycosyltransferase involved in cell wall biosynthesis